LKEHTWDVGEVTTPATITAAGVRTYTCEICGVTKTKEIPKLPDTTPQPGTTEVPKATLEPGTTEDPEMKPKPGTTEYPENTSKPGVPEDPETTPEPGATEIPDPNGSSINTPEQNRSNASGNAGSKNRNGISKVNLKKGMCIREKKTNGIYIVTKVTAEGGTVAYKKPIKNKANIKIPDQIRYQNIILKVTAVKSKAFYKNNKIKKCTIGKNINTLGSKTFYGCKKLSCVKIRSKKLVKVGKKAFTRMGYKAKMIKIYVPKKYAKKYKTLFRKRGLASRAAFRIR
ncbi:MAG: leucine-rich repeat protein, partial [Eubacteriales bacterium]|nr:leucine-rich repeat protein [Eubacteriales bacterium]